MIQEKIYSYFNNNPQLHILFIFDPGGDFCYELEREEWPTNYVYHEFDGKEACAGIFNPDAGAGLRLRFDPTQLPYLTEWKMMGEKDYVLGLEPMNATLDGRKGLRESGKLPYIEPGEERDFEVRVDFYDSKETFLNYS